MAFTVGEVSATITADQKPFNRAMRDVRKRGAQVAADVQKQFRNVGRRMQSVGAKLTAGLTLPLIGAGGMALKTAADYETLRQSMNALNGSAEEGAKQFNRLKKFSAQTPFQLKDLADAQNMLQGFGQSADDAFESMKMIGDIAAISGGDIKGIGIAFGQAAAEGRVMTRDIRQFINQGVPMIKLLANTMGVAQSQILDLASQGKISFEILQKAFRQATSEGGMFANGMEQQAKTLAGVWSTLRDNFSIALGEIGKSLEKTFHIKDLMKGLITNIQSGIKWFNSLSEGTRRMAFYVAGLLGASGPIIVALGTLTAALGAISWPVVLGVAAFAGAATAIIKNWDSVVEYFTSGEGQKIWSTVKDTMSSFVNAVSAFWETFGSNIVSIVKGTFTTVVNLVGAGLEGLSVVLDVWSGKWLTNWDQFLEDTESSFSDTFGSGGYLESIAQSWWQRFLQNDPIVNAGNWISTVLGLDGPMQQASNEAQKESQKTAQYISSVYKNLSDKLKSIDFSFSTSDVGGSSQIKKQFKDIEQASLDLGISLSNNLAGGIEDMKASLPSALQGLSATEIALEKTKEQAQVMGQALQSTVTNAISSFATTLGNVFTGDAGAKGFFNNILTIVADFANKFGKLLIGAGSAALAFKNLLANPIAAIAAGAALIVASTAVKNLLKKGPSTSVNDALVRSDGSVVKFNKADSLLAMKDFGGLATAMGNAQPRQSRPMISEGRLAGAIGKELDKRLQRLGDNEIFAMAQRGRRSY